MSILSRRKAGCRGRDRDIDEPESRARAMELGVTNVPTLVINGKYKIVGAPRSVEELAQMIDQSQRG